VPEAADLEAEVHRPARVEAAVQRAVAVKAGDGEVRTGHEPRGRVGKGRRHGRADRHNLAVVLHGQGGDPVGADAAQVKAEGQGAGAVEAGVELAVGQQPGQGEVGVAVAGEVGLGGPAHDDLAVRQGRYGVRLVVRVTAEAENGQAGVAERGVE